MKTSTALMPTTELAALGPAEWKQLTTRSAVPDIEVRRAAADIVADVAARGDAAVIEANRRYGGGDPNGRLRVDRVSIDAAYRAASSRLIDALRTAITNVRSVHEAQRPGDAVAHPLEGVSIQRRWQPLDSVGAYVPGGGAAYPSSLVMTVVPARVGGVRRVAVTCPAGPNGTVDPAVLTAARLLDIDEVYAVGGAQAVAALAFGTETIPKVDKIVGPGGAWVTAAKLAVYGTVGVDLPAGPSEAVILADRSTDPDIAAADLLCQAEHGPDSIVVLAVTDAATADAIVAAAERQLAYLERAETIRRSLHGSGRIVIGADVAELAAFVNEWAPEHASVLTEDPGMDAERITAAGSVFVGAWTPEAAGDYATGANHVLPTGGLAAAYGPLGTEDFGSWRQVQELTADGLEALATTITTLAEAEGLTAHANSVTVRTTRHRRGSDT